MALAHSQVGQSIGFRRKRKLIQLRQLPEQRVGEPRRASRSELLEPLDGLGDSGAFRQAHVKQLVGAHPERAQYPWFDSRELDGGELSHRAIERDLPANCAVAQLGHESGVARVQPGTVLDLTALRSKVTQLAPSASVDDHRAWIERMRSMTGATVFAGIGILALVIIATVISVSFATRGAMAANRPIVEVLHFVGAGDRYIANRFLRHFLRLGLQGGVIGGGVAMLAFGFSESIASWFSGTPVGDQFAALLGTFSLRPSGYLALAAQAVLIAAITAWASRRTLFATLDDID